MKYPQRHWDIGLIRTKAPTDTAHDHHAGHYSIRLLKYWFVHHMLAGEAARNGRLTVLEVGADLGQLQAYCRAVQPENGQALPWTRWDAVDPLPHGDILHAKGYNRLYEADFYAGEHHLDQAIAYDAIVLLHLLERLPYPERTLSDFLAYLKPGGVLIGGCGQRRSRFQALDTRRLKRFAHRQGLRLEFLGGAFGEEKKRRIPASQGWRLRLALLAGALFPALASERYWVFRRQANYPGCFTLRR